MKELFKTGGEMPDTNYVFMVSPVTLSVCITILSNTVLYSNALVLL